MAGHNAGDPKAVNQREQKRADERKQELEDVKWLLKHQSGVRFLKRLFSEGRIFSSTFTGNSQGFFLEGQRNLALVFLGDVVEAAPEKLADLLVDREVAAPIEEGDGDGSDN